MVSSVASWWYLVGPFRKSLVPIWLIEGPCTGQYDRIHSIQETSDGETSNLYITDVTYKNLKWTMA